MDKEIQIWRNRKGKGERVSGDDSGRETGKGERK